MLKEKGSGHSITFNTTNANQTSQYLTLFMFNKVKHIKTNFHTDMIFK